jgi:hypothetical protein
MDVLATLLKWEIGLFLLGLAIIIVSQILSGKISTRGLLREKNTTEEFSWSRVQLLVFTIIVTLICLCQILTHPVKFPEISWAWLLVLGGSNLVFLGDKAYKLLIRNLPK